MAYVFSITFRLRKRVRSTEARLILKDIPGSRKWDLLMAKDFPASSGKFVNSKPSINAPSPSWAVYVSVITRRPTASPLTVPAERIYMYTIADSSLSRTKFLGWWCDLVLCSGSRSLPRKAGTAVLDSSALAAIIDRRYNMADRARACGSAYVLYRGQSHPNVPAVSRP